MRCPAGLDEQKIAVKVQTVFRMYVDLEGKFARSLRERPIALARDPHALGADIMLIRRQLQI